MNIVVWHFPLPCKLLPRENGKGAHIYGTSHMLLLWQNMRNPVSLSYTVHKFWNIPTYNVFIPIWHAVHIKGTACTWSTLNKIKFMMSSKRKMLCILFLLCVVTWRVVTRPLVTWNIMSLEHLSDILVTWRVFFLLLHAPLHCVILHAGCTFISCLCNLILCWISVLCC